MASPCVVRITSTPRTTATLALVAMAMPSSARRMPRNSGFMAAMAAATSSGMTTGSGSSGSIAVPLSALELDKLVRIERAESLVRLDGYSQQQGGYGSLDDDVGQRERLHDGVDGGRARRDVREVRRDRAAPVADRQEQHVGGGLDDDQADDLVHQVPAGDDAVQPDGQDPRHHDEGECLHR